MKQISVAVFIIFSAYLSCFSQGETSDNKILTHEIIYNVRINNFYDMVQYEGDTYSWKNEHIFAPYRTTFLTKLYDAACSGKLNITDTNNNPVKGKDLKETLRKYDSLVIFNPEPPYDIYDAIICSDFDPLTISGLQFKEKWTYNPATMEIYKKVLAYAPLVEVYSPYSGDFLYLKPVFWINLPDLPPSEDDKILTPRINYNAYFSPDSNRNVSTGNYFQEYNKQLTEKAFSDKLFAVRLEDMGNEITPTIAKVKGKELYKELTIPDTLDLIDNTVIISNEIYPDSIIGYRFTEEWKINLTTMNFTKTVTGIAPFMAYRKPPGRYSPDLYDTRLLFWILFHDLWLPFDEKISIEK